MATLAALEKRLEAAVQRVATLEEERVVFPTRTRHHYTLAGRGVDDHLIYERVFNPLNFDRRLQNASVQKALDAANAAGGGIVFLPPGTWLFSNNVTLYSNVILRGAGWATVIKMKDGADLTQLIAGTSLDSIIIENLALDGNKANQTGNFQHGIRLTDCTNVLIDHVYAHDFSGATGAGNEATGIRLRGTSFYEATATIADCIAESNDGVGIGCYNIGKVSYVGCHAYNNLSMGLSFSNAAIQNTENIIAACESRDNSEANFNLEYQSDMVVSGCASSGNSGGSALAGLRIADSRRVVVSGYVSESDEIGIRTASTTTTLPDSISINDAYIFSSTSEGILLVGGSSTGARISLSNVTVLAAGDDGIDVRSTIRSFNFSGGEVVNSADVGIRCSADTDATIQGVRVHDNTNSGIRADMAGYVTISGCTVTLNGAYGIYLGTTAKGGVVSANTVCDNGTNTGNTYDGIFLDSVNQFVISENNCSDNQTTATQRSGVRENGTSDYNTVVGNVARNNTGTQIVMAGANSKAAHNVGLATHTT